METLPGRWPTESTSITWMEADGGEFYPKDRDDSVNFEAITWKRSQRTETIGTIEGYPRNHHFYSSIDQ